MSGRRAAAAVTSLGMAISGLSLVALAGAPAATADTPSVEVYDHFGGSGPVGGKVAEVGGRNWMTPTGAWTRADGVATTSVAVSANPMIIADLNAPDVDVRASANGPSGLSVFFRVQDADDFLRARIRRSQTTTYPTEYAHQSYFTNREFTRRYWEYEYNDYTTEKQWQNSTWQKSYYILTPKWEAWWTYDVSDCKASAGDVNLPANTSTTQYQLGSSSTSGCTGGKRKWNKQRRDLGYVQSDLWVNGFDPAPAGYTYSGTDRYVPVGQPYFGTAQPGSGSTWAHETGVTRDVLVGTQWTSSPTVSLPDKKTGQTRIASYTGMWTLFAKALSGGYSDPCVYWVPKAGETIDCTLTGRTEQGDPEGDPVWNTTPCDGCTTRQSPNPVTEDHYQIRLSKTVAGSTSNLGLWEVGNAAALRVTAEGTTIKVYSGTGTGTLVDTVTDGTFADQTQHGCGIGGSDTYLPIDRLSYCYAKSLAPLKLMVVGDSISQGLEGDYTWRYRLKDYLNGANVSTDFVGPWTGTNVIPASLPTDPDTPAPAVHTGAYRPGVTFADNQNLAQWGWELSQAKWDIASRVQASSPDYLLVELGFNDLGWGVTDPSGLVAGLREFVANARAAKPDIKILVANLVHRTPLAANPDLPARTTTYNNLLPAAVGSMSTAQSPVAMVDLDSAYSPTGDTYDGLHPNVRGEYVIAKAFADVLANRFGVGPGFGSVPVSLPSNLVPAQPATPTVAKNGLGLTISWPHVFAANSYQLYRRDLTLGETGWTPYNLSGVPNPIGADSWTEPSMPAGHQYEFKLTAMRGSAAVGAESGVGAGTVKALPVVPNLKAVVEEQTPHTVKLTWDPVAGADDYHVYKADSCGLLPPPDSSYQQVQFDLKDKTTWSQEFVMDDCVTYAVVASRLNGEGPKQAEPVKVYPKFENVWWQTVHSHFWEDDLEDGAKRGTTWVPGVPGPDNGIVVAQAFIRDADTITGGIGDHRQFDDTPGASAKIAVAWDTATNEVAVYVHRSCVWGATVSFVNFNLGCHDAKPVGFLSNAYEQNDTDTNDFNYVTAEKYGQNGMRIEWAAMNSWEPLIPEGRRLGRINTRVSLTPDGNGSYNVIMDGDRFPSWEVYRYPRNAMKVLAMNGVAYTLGTRDQNDISDLENWPRHHCFSYGEEIATTRPMSCTLLQDPSA